MSKKISNSTRQLLTSAIESLTVERNKNAFAFNGLVLAWAKEIHHSTTDRKVSASVFAQYVPKQQKKDVNGVLETLSKQLEKNRTPKQVRRAMLDLRDAVATPSTVDADVMNTPEYREFRADEEHTIAQIGELSREIRANENDPEKQQGLVNQMRATISKFVARWQSASWLTHAGAASVVLGVLAGMLLYFDTFGITTYGLAFLERSIDKSYIDYARSWVAWASMGVMGGAATGNQQQQNQQQQQQQTPPRWFDYKGEAPRGKTERPNFFANNTSYRGGGASRTFGASSAKTSSWSSARPGAAERRS